MGTILALGLAAAVYPQLLAVVAVILTRANPRRLLWACYLGAAGMSVAGAVVALVVFRARGSLAGTSSRELGAGAYLIVGGITLLIAALTATERGRQLLGAARVRRQPRERSAPGFGDRVKSRTEHALMQGSAALALIVGVILGIPGPFDLLAHGDIARGRHELFAVIVLVAVFVALKLLLIELPIASYAIDPDGTSMRVERFTAWMKERRFEVIAAVLAVIGFVLLARGIVRLG